MHDMILNLYIRTYMNVILYTKRESRESHLEIVMEPLGLTFVA